MSIIERRLAHCVECNALRVRRESDDGLCTGCMVGPELWDEDHWCWECDLEADNWWESEPTEHEDRAMVVGGRSWRDPS